MSKLKVALRTMGCRVNLYDSSWLLGATKELPLSLVEFEAEADVYIINSCTVTANADAEVRNLARRARRASPHAKVVVIGCMASRDAEALLSMPEVDAVFPNLEKPKVPQFLAQTAKEVLSLTETPSPDDDPIPDTSDRSRPLLKIQEGCEQNCTFCIIPSTRGKERSRSLESVVTEIERVVALGAKEVVLTGVHLGSYGRDLKTEDPNRSTHKEEQPETSLAALLREVERRKLVHRVRLSSLEPWGVTSELLEAFSESASLCAHLHLPLQSGDAEVLRAMNRPYTPERYAQIVREVYARFPNACIGTDVIVGFPGETEAAFENTRALLASLPISYFHVFPFSARPNTPAARMERQVPVPEIRRRSQVLRELGSQKKLAFATSWLGREVEALVEAKRDKATGLLRGTTREYLTVIFEGPDSLLRGCAKVKLFSLEGNVSRGVLQEESSTGEHQDLPTIQARLSD